MKNKCKDCELTKLVNPENPICNFHQGYDSAVVENKLKLIESTA
jgi:hypothetical protein